jgi:acyl-CoA thioester hydrolase
MKQPIHFPPASNPRVPQAQFPFYHSVELQTRFNDIDMLGHLNNNVYLTFMDLGKTRYFSDVINDHIDWHNPGHVIVHITCDYYAQAFLNEPLAVASTIVSVSVHSFKLEQRIYNSVTGEVKCIGQTIMSGFDMATGRSAEINPEWVELFSRYEGRDLRKKS